jgi:hypothetical protein
MLQPAVRGVEQRRRYQEAILVSAWILPLRMDEFRLATR